MRGGRLSPSGEIPRGGLLSSVERAVFVAASTVIEPSDRGRAVIPVPQRCIILHDASQAILSGQSPSQHGSAAALIESVTFADASKDDAPKRVTASNTARSDRTNQNMSVG